MLYVLVVGGNLRASKAALDSASCVLIRNPFQIGSFCKVLSRIKNENLDIMEKILNMDNAEEYLSYLQSAPDLASIFKILILIPNWSDFPLQYIGNKPPNFST